MEIIMKRIRNRAYTHPSMYERLRRWDSSLFRSADIFFKEIDEGEEEMERVQVDKIWLLYSCLGPAVESTSKVNSSPSRFWIACPKPNHKQQNGYCSPSFGTRVAAPRQGLVSIIAWDKGHVLILLAATSRMKTPLAKLEIWYRKAKLKN